MRVAPALTVLDGGLSPRSRQADGASSPSDSWNHGEVTTVEIVAPDHYCATLLLDHAAPRFPAEIVCDPGWIVRFEPPSTSPDWVTELLALVGAWLVTAPLPCAKVRHGDREYLVRAPTGPALTPWDAA